MPASNRITAITVTNSTSEKAGCGLRGRRQDWAVTGRARKWGAKIGAKSARAKRTRWAAFCQAGIQGDFVTRAGFAAAGLIGGHPVLSPC
jgi:hypothetical protein